MPDFANISIGVAALLMLVYIMRTTRNMMKDNQDFLSGHIRMMSDAMRESAAALDELTNTINLNREKTIRSHTILASRVGGKVGAALTEAMAEENGTDDDERSR